MVPSRDSADPVGGGDPLCVLFSGGWMIGKGRESLKKRVEAEKTVYTAGVNGAPTRAALKLDIFNALLILELHSVCLEDTPHPSPTPHPRSLALVLTLPFLISTLKDNGSWILTKSFLSWGTWSWSKIWTHPQEGGQHPF